MVLSSTAIKLEAMRNPAIEVKGLTKDFGSLRAVDSLTFRVESGDAFGFLGPNGAGKTTTLRMLAGIIPPSAGTAYVLGDSIRSASPWWKNRIGLVPEAPGFYPTMTAREHMLFWAGFHRLPRTEARARLRDILAVVGLGDHVHTKLKAFSHGMRRRLSLGQALLSDPDVLFLDEPTGGLDPAGTAEFRNLISRFREEGRTILLSSHLLDQVERICNRISLLHKGRLLVQGSMRDLRRSVPRLAEECVEIRANGVTEPVLGEIRSLPGVTTVKGERGRFVVCGRDSEALASEITVLLVGAGSRVLAVTPQKVDLEKIYLALTGEGDA